jgi:hypothetical protein
MTRVVHLGRPWVAQYGRRWWYIHGRLLTVWPQQPPGDKIAIPGVNDRLDRLVEQVAAERLDRHGSTSLAVWPIPIVIIDPTVRVGTGP